LTVAISKHSPWDCGNKRWPFAMNVSNGCICAVHQAKKVSIEGVKRPRGRPPLPETLKRRMKEQQISRSTVDSAKPLLSAAANLDKRQSQTPVKPAPSPPTPSPPEKSPVVVKKRRQQGLRGMARLLVKQPGSKVNGSAKQSFRSPPEVTAEVSPWKRQLSETLDMGKPESPMETCTNQTTPMMPSLSSPIWQPASKRVLDAVCVTDVTACSGVTVTVRESSVVDGFFRSRPEEP